MSTNFRSAVYPGSFNPVHNGHLDIIRRAARLFDVVYVAVYENPDKPFLFDTAQRIEMIEYCTQSMDNIRVASFAGLAVDYLAEVNSSVMIRGLRVFSDFEYEFRMALANQRLSPNMEVIHFMTSETFLHISSTTVREIASLGGDVSSFVPKYVEDALVLRYAELKKK